MDPLRTTYLLAWASQVLTARSPRPSVEVAARCVWEIMGYRDIKTNRKVIVLNKLRDELEVMTTVMSYSLSHLSH